METSKVLQEVLADLKMTRVKIRTAATNSFLQVTSIYCLLGLALISMGISLASEQVQHFKNVDSFVVLVEELGCKR